MCVDMCLDTRMGMCMGMCVDKQADMGMDMSIDTCVDMLTCVGHSLLDEPAQHYIARAKRISMHMSVRMFWGWTYVRIFPSGLE